MSTKINYYELSDFADKDLDEIFDYTEKEYGFNQAEKYLNELEIVFISLVANPYIGRARNEIKKDLFSITEQKHTIFYRIIDDYIRIVRVLHGSKDVLRFFI